MQTATDFAAQALDEERPREQLADELLAAFAEVLGRGALPAVRRQDACVWVYGDRDYELEDGCAWLEEMQLAMAGDWAYNGRVEGAWLSGRAAAQRVIDARAKAAATG